MRPPTPLPQELLGQTFTRSQARALGVSDARLRARDVQKMARATYRHLTPDAPSPPAERVSPEVLSVLCRRSPAIRVSHVTAALLYRVNLPSRLVRDAPIHLTGRSRSHYGAADPPVRLHRSRVGPGSTHQLHGIPVTAPAELFVEMAQYLSATELVVLGDQLVRAPRQKLEGRSAPWCSVPALRRSVAGAKHRFGIRRAREALELVRVGSDSPPETLLRLALCRAGLPEPELQIRLDARDPYSPAGDLGYRDGRLVMQYEGEHHFSAEQQARDERRNAAFQMAGWTVIQVNRVDLREDFAGAVQRTRTLLERRRSN
ncbi:hypothetical protein FEF26_03040 [Nesterenkonia salmonea]|uniref:DUF559 domain-containing protein n=1 Tax=Nesterenkonia salmonea TaxID=1804987 RepID=A0A5R9BHF0_9MICC|nr:hypothetical protein [Nesterenkonia salmonea]TLP99591.1 hypothetical protein FEF26_03040 [Nesterenkonia salmonea]